MFPFIAEKQPVWKFGQEIHNFKIKLGSNVPKEGPDGIQIQSFFIRDLICVLARPLCGLFNAFLAQGTYPNRWKEAKICPIHSGRVIGKMWKITDP